MGEAESEYWGSSQIDSDKETEFKEGGRNGMQVLMMILCGENRYRPATGSMDFTCHVWDLRG